MAVAGGVYDVSVSLGGGLVVAVSSSAPVLLVYANTHPTFPLLATFGSLSTSSLLPGVFSNPRAAVFSQRGTALAPLLLVADTYNDRIQELRVAVTATGSNGVPTAVTITFVRFLLEDLVSGPIALTTTNTLLGVSEIRTRTVAVFDMTAGGSVPTLLWRTSPSAGLSVPFGLRFTWDGVHVAVADYSNHRVALLALRGPKGGSYVRDAANAAHGVRLPQDLEECDSGFLVLNTVSPVTGSGTSGVTPLVTVPKDGSAPVPYLGGFAGAVGNATGQVLTTIVRGTMPLHLQSEGPMHDRIIMMSMPVCTSGVKLSKLTPPGP
jgi:hypothetical protein